MSRPTVRRRTLVLGALGLLGTLVAAAFVVVPNFVSGSPLSSVAEATADADSEQVLLAVAAVVALLTLWAARTRREPAADDAFDDLTATPPETVVTDDDAVAGRRFDEQFEGAVVHGGWREEEEAVPTLRSTAVDVLSLTTTEEAARQAVEQGTWTDDPLAAAMLAGPDGPRPSIWARLRQWLDPAAERERRLRRTVCALETAVDETSTQDRGQR
jgi:hypothetical protein